MQITLPHRHQGFASHEAFPVGFGGGHGRLGPGPETLSSQHGEHQKRGEHTNADHGVGNPCILCVGWPGLDQPRKAYVRLTGESLRPFEQVRRLVGSNGQGCRMVVEKFSLGQHIVRHVRRIQQNINSMTVDHRQHHRAIGLLPPTFLGVTLAFYRKQRKA